MYSDDSALKQLSRDECLRLLASVPVGRIIYTRQALPAVELVNFALDNGDIVIRTDHGGKLAAATRGAVVAFEADSVDIDRHVGWSVTAIGHSHEVTDPDEIDRLERIGLTSWAPGERDQFIRISPGILHGRRLSVPGSEHPHQSLPAWQADQVITQVAPGRRDERREAGREPGFQILGGRRGPRSPAFLT